MSLYIYLFIGRLSLLQTFILIQAQIVQVDLCLNYKDKQKGRLIDSTDILMKQIFGTSSRDHSPALQ